MAIPIQGGVTTMRSRFAYLLFSLLAFSLTLLAQIQPIPNLTVQPVPIPGGDLVPGFGIVNAFVPGPSGQTPPFDPMGADPHVITNFKGLTAMGYTSGLATDNQSKQWIVVTDIRVYKGDYIGGTTANLPADNTAGATASAKASGIFVEI
jgi:hypothetical protein